MSAIDALWNSLKIPRQLRVGPVSLVLRMARRVKVSNNWRRRWFERWSTGAVPLTVPPQRSRLDAPSPQAEVAAQPPVVRPGTAVVVGVGPGLGHALARTLAAAGMNVALASRNAERLDPLVAELRSGAAGTVRAYGCDATDVRSVDDLLAHVNNDMGVPDLVIFAVQSFGPGRAIDVELPAFEDNWRQNCLGGFIVARAAARAMVAVQRGTIVLVGSTSGLIGRADHLNLAVGKFGLRALAQVMARELWPEGIHVVHCVIDADIREGPPHATGHPQADPDDLARMIHALHMQPRSCWTSELDLRPWNERFWEHC